MESEFFLILLLPVLWIGITAFLSLISGWHNLSSTFCRSETATGEVFNGVSGTIGRKYFPVNYSNCLSITVTPQGFYIRLLFIFRILSPQLYLPWQKIESVTEHKYFFLFPYTRIVIRDHWQTISIYGRASKAITASYSSFYGSRRR
ncbi:MAG: hypothetical protein ACREPB_06695 [Arenimonas sp.]